MSDPRKNQLEFNEIMENEIVEECEKMEIADPDFDKKMVEEKKGEGAVKFVSREEENASSIGQVSGIEREKEPSTNRIFSIRVEFSGANDNVDEGSKVVEEREKMEKADPDFDEKMVEEKKGEEAVEFVSREEENASSNIQVSGIEREKEPSTNRIFAIRVNFSGADDNDAESSEAAGSSSSPAAPKAPWQSVKAHKPSTVQYEKQEAITFTDADAAMKFVKENPKQNLFVWGAEENKKSRAFLVRAAFEMAALGKKVLLKTNSEFEKEVLEEVEKLKTDGSFPDLHKSGRIFKTEDFDQKQRDKEAGKSKNLFNKKFRNMQMIICPWDNREGKVSAFVTYVADLTKVGRFIPDVAIIDTLNLTTNKWLELNMLIHPKQIIASFEEGKRGVTYMSLRTSAVTGFIFADGRENPRDDINYVHLKKSADLKKIKLNGHYFDFNWITTSAECLKVFRPKVESFTSGVTVNIISGTNARLNEAAMESSS